MAQVFPLTADELASEGGRPSLAGTLAALPEPWTLLLSRRIGDEPADPVAMILIHPEIGIALVNEVLSDPERDPESGVAALQTYLEEQRFSEFFPGDLPIVALAVAAEDLPVVGERLAAAFEGAPRLSIADRDWADAVVELLLLPDDLNTAPAAEEMPIVPTRDAAEADPWPVEEERFEREAEPPLILDNAALSGGAELPLPLLADWPMAAASEPSRWRGRVAIGALSLIFLGGLGVAAWQLGSDDPTLSSTPRLTPSERVELALPHPPQLKPTLEAPSPRDEPPPLPGAPPVVMAEKPLASPPPIPPKPTPVEPLPSVTANPPPTSPSEPPVPAQTAAAQTQSSSPASPTDKKEPPARDTHSPPSAQPQPAQASTRDTSTPPIAAPVAEASKPPRIAKATPPPARREAPQPLWARPPQETGKQAAERPEPEMRGPPIDAADLPPLPATAAPQDQPVGNVGAPRSLAPSRAEAGTAVALGPPVPLGPRVANARPAAPSTRECRPYTSDTSLTGRGLAVRGIACRGSDGQWRLVSEVPLR